jgi:alkaline phosphatase D
MAKREAALMPDRRTQAAPATPSTAPAPLPRGLLDSLQLLSSVLFRVLVYVFLQWIPTSAAWPAVPLLFGTYAFTWSVHAWRLSRRNAAARALREMASAIPVGQLRLGAAAGRQAIAHTAGDEKPSEGSALLPAPATDEHAAPVAHVEPTKVARPGFFAKIAPSIFGLSTSSPGGNLLALAQHVLLLLFFLDAFSSPYLFPSHHEHTLHFARVGHLSPSSAVLHVRYPFPLGHEATSDWSSLLEDESGGRSTLRAGSEIYQNPAPLRIVYREALAPRAERDIDGRARSQPKRWERGPAVTLTEATDWTGTATLDGLWPATAYEWRLAFVHNSTFAPHPHRPRSFVTWPDPKLARKRLAGAPQGQEGQATPLDDPNQ